MAMTRFRTTTHGPILLSLGLLTAACSPAPKADQPKASELWGDMKPVVSVKELMHDMIDPASDFVFDAVSQVMTKDGLVEKSPKTDEDWDKIRFGAVTMAEGAYLLKVQRPFAPENVPIKTMGAEHVELSPQEMMAKVRKDPVEWNARIEALRNVGLEVLDIVKKKDAKELWDASENLDEACESCHRSYWYPKEDDAFYRALDKRLRDTPAPKQSFQRRP